MKPLRYRKNSWSRSYTVNPNVNLRIMVGNFFSQNIKGEQEFKGN